MVLSKIVFKKRVHHLLVGYIHWLLLWSCMLWAQYARCQTKTFDYLTINEGLSNNTIYTILEDRDGFLWLGSRDGLNRFDGYECAIYKSSAQDSTSLSDNRIQCLYEDKKGNIWVGLRRGGINILQRKTHTFVRNPFPKASLPFDLSKVTIQTIFEDSFGGIWIGTLGNGIIHTNSSLDKFEFFSTKSKNKTQILNSDLVFDFAEDAQHNIWIATQGTKIHCLQYQTKQINLFESDPSKNLDFSSYSKSLLYHKGKVWIGTQGNGLYIYDTALKTFQHHKLGNNLVTDIALDQQNQVWITTDGSGLFITDEEAQKFEYFDHTPTFKNSLNTNALYNIYTDTRNNTWIGTFNGGVNIYKPYKNNFLTFLHTSQDSFNPNFQSVLSFCENKQNSQIWIGTDGGGLLIFDKKTQTYSNFESVVKFPKGVSNSVITAIYEDSKQNLWIGTFSNGLNRYQPSTGKIKNYQNLPNDTQSLAVNNVWDIVEDQDACIWIGTLGGGLDKYDPKNDAFMHYVPHPQQPTSLSDVQVQVLMVDSKNNLWIGTEYGGLNKLPPHRKAFKHWKKEENLHNGLQANSILSLLEDRKQRIWVGTEGGGLHLLSTDESSFKNYTTKDGLPSDVINALVQDPAGSIWISTNAGIALFDPEKEIFVNFNKEDGLQSGSFNPNAALLTQEGVLFFGGIQGFNVFMPSQIKENDRLPRAAFTDFRLFGQSIKNGKYQNRQLFDVALNDEPTISLSYFDNVFTIEFTALEYTNPSKNKIAYRLVGFQEEWNYAKTTQRSATFTNLDAGTYTFEIKVGNALGKWDENPKRLTIQIAPPFWQTYWFKGLIGIFILALFGAYVRYQNWLKKEEYQKKLLLAEQTMLQQNNAHLEEEIKRQNAEIAASLLQFAHKNSLFEDLKKELEILIQSEKENKNTFAKIRQLSKKIDEEVKSESYWEQFHLNFDKIHQDFSKKLSQKHPELTPNDIRLCCFIRINMTNAEIAEIQNISIRGVEKSRYRLKKKLNLENEELHHYVLHFE